MQNITLILSVVFKNKRIQPEDILLTWQTKEISISSINTTKIYSHLELFGLSNECWDYGTQRAQRAGCIPNHYGVRSATSGGSRRLDLRLGPLSPCKWRAKKYHFAGVPRKKFGVQNDRVDTNSAVDTKKKNIFAFLLTDFSE